MQQDIRNRPSIEIVPDAPTDPDAFLRWASQRPREEGRYELSRGVVTVQMSNVTAEHNRIATNILVWLATSLDRDLYEIGPGDLNTRTPFGVRSPDVFVSEPVTARKALAADHPLLLVEVLSPSSEGRDFTEKRDEYLAIGSLQAYLICSQDEPRIWIFARGLDGRWPDRPVMIEGRDSVIALSGLGLALPMAVVYRGIPDRIMTLKIRIIPCLDVKDGRVVKGVNFVDLRDAGDPVEAAAAYDAAGADELTFLDITASHEKRGIILDIVERTAERCFMPLTVGGGISTVEDIRRLLEAGADKASINTAAVKRRDFVREAAEKFGAQCIVVAIDAKKVSPPGAPDRWEIFTHGGRNADRARSDRLCARGGVTRRRRDPADIDGPRRHESGLRPRADAGDRRRGAGAGDRLGRRRYARPSRRRRDAGPRQRRARRLDLPLRHLHDPAGEAAYGCGRCGGADGRGDVGGVSECERLDQAYAARQPMSFKASAASDMSATCANGSTCFCRPIDTFSSWI